MPFNPNQTRDKNGRWSDAAGGLANFPASTGNAWDDNVANAYRSVDYRAARARKLAAHGGSAKGWGASVDPEKAYKQIASSTYLSTHSTVDDRHMPKPAHHTGHAGARPRKVYSRRAGLTPFIRGFGHDPRGPGAG